MARTAIASMRAGTVNGRLLASKRRGFHSAVFASVLGLTACAAGPSLVNSSLVLSTRKSTPAPNVSTAKVLAAVRAAQHVQRVPKSLYSRLANPTSLVRRSTFSA